MLVCLLEGVLILIQGLNLKYLPVFVSEYKHFLFMKLLWGDAIPIWLFLSGSCFAFVTRSHFLMLFWFCFWAESPRLAQYSCCLGGRAVVGQQTHRGLAQLRLHHPEPEPREEPPTGPDCRVVCTLISALYKYHALAESRMEPLGRG